ncbi:MAG TPA: dihydropteroate synthase [Acidobacteriota bacterium]
MSEAGTKAARPLPSDLAERLFPHNAHVIGGYDPLPLPLPDDSPRFHELAASHGAYAVRLQAVPEVLADPFLRALGRAGGAAHTRPLAGESAVDIVVFASLPQIEALRAQLLAAPDYLSRLAEEVIAVLGAYHRHAFKVRCGGRLLECGLEPLIMGVVNCTDDSFYGGSRAMGEAAIERAHEMVEEGAALIDVGGESTRPGGEPVAAEVEIERVVPVIERLAAELDVPISIDTSKARVAEAALRAGATVVNDIQGLAADAELAGVVADAGAAVILMHMRGSPGTMYDQSRYQDLVADIVRELRQALGRARRAGIDAELTLVDPGIGFAKRPQQNFTLLRHLSALRSLGRPLVVGPSRKSFVGALLDLPPEQRLEGTAAAVAAAILAGAHIVRVHDVGPMKRVAAVAAAIRTEGAGSR